MSVKLKVRNILYHETQRLDFVKLDQLDTKIFGLIWTVIAWNVRLVGPQNEVRKVNFSKYQTFFPVFSFPNFHQSMYK